MEETAALLSSSATKQRLAGVTELLQQLRKQDATSEASVALIPRVIPCLRDHNWKITLGALEILELLVVHVSENMLGSYLKLLWLSLVDRLGDSKLQVREKAVDVVVGISLVLGVSPVLEKLRLCMTHKNWRTREQSLHAIWRCFEQHELFQERQDEVLEDVVKLLEDSSKDVRDAAMTTLAKFYTYIGPSLLIDLQGKGIRAGHMATLEERFQRIPLRIKSAGSVASAIPSENINTTYSGALASNDGLPETLSSMLSSYDVHAPSSSSSSMARYLESVRNRTLNEAKTAAAVAHREPSQESSTSHKAIQDFSLMGASSAEVSDKEIQKQLGAIFDKLELDNNWDKRVDGLKTLQKLTIRCSKAPNSDTAISSLSHGLRLIRERLCQQVVDLRSSVSREACETIQTLAKCLQDEFNAHAEICLGNLLKATYVTIQVISTAADTTIRTMIECTSNGYVRVIPKLIECAKSRNHVLRYNAVCYLTLTLQRWSMSFLSKHSESFVLIMPAILRDALSDVRAQSRKCYWSFHHLFPEEAESVFARLDGSTQKNLKDDSSQYSAKAARQTDCSSLETHTSPSGEVELTALRATNAPQPPLSTSTAVNSVTFSDDKQFDITSEESAAGKLPRRVLGDSSSEHRVDGAEESAQTSRMLARPLRVGLAALAKSSLAKDTSEVKKSAAAGPLRVRNASNSVPPPNATVESLYTSRQESSTAGFHTSSKPVSKVQRVQRAVEVQAPMEIDENDFDGPKRLPIASMASPTASNASSSKTNASSKGDSNDHKPKRAAPVNSSERSKGMPSQIADQLEEALRNLESRSWSTRLEAAEYIGKLLQRRVDQMTDDTNGDRKVDGRILVAFVKHLSDAHYRVAQGVLKNFLPLLQLIEHKQLLLPHLKFLLPKLFQKFIDTKESIRVIAKEILEHIASRVDNSTLAALVISQVGDGSNMKVKAAMCHYLRELLPGAETYMRNGPNHSHMRSFLLKIALLVDVDVPVSVSSACGELIAITAQLYGHEMETALGSLPPSKRLIVAKVLKSKKLVLNGSNAQKPPLSSTAHPLRLRDGEQENETLGCPGSRRERSRKRPESPNVTSSSSARQHGQKRVNTASQAATEDQLLDVPTISPAGSRRGNDGVPSPVTASFSSTLPSSQGIRMDKDGLQLEDILCILEQNNMSDMEEKRALCEILHRIETESSETWDRCFGRLLLVLVDAGTQKNAKALKVLQKLVQVQRSRAQMFLELLVHRLLDATNDQSGVACHLIEHILRNLVSSAVNQQQTLSILSPLLASKEPPALQTILRLVKLCLQQCEQNRSQNMAFLRDHDVGQCTLNNLTRCLSHSSSNVRKNAVDCLVAFHFAVMEDDAIVLKYLATQVDDTQQRLVEIFIDRVKMERHHVPRE